MYVCNILLNTLTKAYNVCKLQYRRSSQGNFSEDLILRSSLNRMTAHFALVKLTISMLLQKLVENIIKSTKFEAL